jgi:hypothetical protein
MAAGALGGAPRGLKCSESAPEKKGILAGA